MVFGMSRFKQLSPCRRLFNLFYVIQEPIFAVGAGSRMIVLDALFMDGSLGKHFKNYNESICKKELSLYHKLKF